MLHKLPRQPKTRFGSYFSSIAILAQSHSFSATIRSAINPFVLGGTGISSHKPLHSQEQIITPAKNTNEHLPSQFQWEPSNQQRPNPFPIAQNSLKTLPLPHNPLKIFSETFAKQTRFALLGFRLQKNSLLRVYAHSNE